MRDGKIDWIGDLEGGCPQDELAVDDRSRDAGRRPDVDIRRVQQQQGGWR
jgi:hypothetical protein